jgi:hypothetical protein
MPARHSKISSKSNPGDRRTDLLARASTLVLMGSGYLGSLPGVRRAAYNFSTPARIRG